MADNKAPIRYINGHPVADQEARDRIAGIREYPDAETNSVLISGEDCEVKWRKERMADLRGGEITVNSADNSGMVEGKYAVASSDTDIMGSLAICSDIGDYAPIMWDGKWYEATVAKIDQTIAYGNQAVVEESVPDTGEPFCIIKAPTEPYIVIVFAEAGEHTLTMPTARPLDEKYVPRTIARQAEVDKLSEEIANAVPETNQPHMQLVTDAEGVAKWEERTHYKATEEVVFIKEQSLAFEENSNLGVYAYMINAVFDPIGGTTVKVLWDSVEYTCVATESNGAIVAGNRSMDFAAPGTDSGEPFLVMGMNTMLAVITKDSAASHTVSIRGEVAKYHPIDNNYLLPFAEVVKSYGTLQIAVGETTKEEVEAVTSKYCNIKPLFVRIIDGNGAWSLITLSANFDPRSIASDHYQFSNVMSLIKYGQLDTQTMFKLMIEYTDGIVTSCRPLYTRSFHMESYNGVLFNISINDDGTFEATKVTE